MADAEAPPAGDDYDGPLLPFADFMNVLGEHEGQVIETAAGESLRLTVTELSFDLPMELRVRPGQDGDREGGLDLWAGPPTQRVETTVFPVLHRLRVRLVRSDEVRQSSAGSPGVEEGTWHGTIGGR